MSEQQDQLTHLDASGRASMVDVGDKEVTSRRAVATGTIIMKAATLALLEANELKKGDAFSVARIAAIQAAKRTSDLIPLCHPLPDPRRCIAHPGFIAAGRPNFRELSSIG